MRNAAMRGLATSVLAAGIALAAMPAATAQERVIAMDHGIHVTLPGGWRLEDPGEDGADATGRKRVHLVCETPDCKRTQETCTFVLRDTPVEGADDAERLAGLYASPLSRYFRLRAVLKVTSKDAQIRQDLAVQRIGSRDWQVVETDARHNYKSGYFAETVIDGRYLGMICKTCETGDMRHRSARTMLESVTSQKVTTISR